MKVTINNSIAGGKLGLVCVILMISLVSLSWHFRCVSEAFRVGSISITAGVTFGSMMALITRSRNPHIIYLALLGAGITLLPLIVGWPAVMSARIMISSKNPESALSYLEALRTILFILAIPTPFAYLGQHTADLD